MGKRIMFVSAMAVLSALSVKQTIAQSDQERENFSIDITCSEKLDAAAFLNALSDQPRFNQSGKAVREDWLKKLAADKPAEAAFARWSGRGIQLAYLLSAIPENDLEATIRRFDDPGPLLRDIETGLDEPAYRPVFEDLKARLDDIRVLFSFFLKNGFREMRDKDRMPAMAAAKADLEKALGSLDVRKFAGSLETFSGRRIPGRRLRIYMLAFSYPFCFQLSGFAVGWAAGREPSVWLLAHEFMHKYNPTAANLEHQRKLADGDKFYKEAWDRIYGEFREGKEEEFVEAAARRTMEQLGVISHVRNLRQLKFLYYSEKVKRGGVPLAAVILEELSKAKITPGEFDYNVFADGLFASGGISAGKVEERYNEAIRPVSGMAGLVLAQEKDKGFPVKAAFPGMPADKAGLMAGDLIIKVQGVLLEGKTQEDALDLLAGSKGALVSLTYRRGDKTADVKFPLQ